MTLSKDLFFIPFEEDEYIIYSPLRRSAFRANHFAVNIIKNYLKNGILSDVEKETKIWEYLLRLENKKVEIPKTNNINIDSGIVVILSQICNLACSYCFAQESRSNEVLNKNKLQILIDHILLNSNRDDIKFSFMGGGEPTATWDVLEWAINYIRTKKIKRQNINISITTNATLLSEHRIDFLKENNVHLGISFDILPDIQNTQRKFPDSTIKSFDYVDKAIKYIIDKNISFRLRTTITKKCLQLMPDMVLFVSERYKNIKKLHFEPVTDIDDNNLDYYNEFIDYFFTARAIGKSNGIDVYNSISNSFNKIRNRFCNLEFCVTPSGSFVSCHRISSEKEKKYHLFNFGQINNEIIIDAGKMREVINFANSKLNECESCFAKWHCAGSCLMERSYFSEQQQLIKCGFIKNTLIKILAEKIMN